MLEQRVSLASNGVVKVPGYEQLLHFGYTKNRGVYRLAVTATGEWDGLTIRAFWHVPDGSDPASSLVADGYVDVPASVTAQSGNGCITFEGSDGTKTVTSADLRYRVSANSGTEDGSMPEPGTPAWQEFIALVQGRLTIGTVTSGDTASASITNGKLNLVLPRGAVGPQGPKGAAGAQGEQGPKGGTGPAGPGFTDAAKGYILALFENAAYKNDTMQATYAALKAEWGMGSGTTVTPSQPEKPSTPVTVPGETAVYELTTPTVFKTAEKKYIDTGVKLFEDISAQPTWTILLDSTDFASLKGLASSAALFHCGTSDDSNIRVIAWKNGGVYFNLYGVDTQLGWWVGSSSAYLRMCLQIRGNQYKLSYDTTEGSWTNIPNYSANIDATLLLGAYREDNGTIGRFWEGNLNKFAVYNKLLTDEQIKTFMEAK